MKNENAKVVDEVAPGTKASKLTIKEACENYLAKKKFKAQWEKSETHGSVRHTLAALNPDMHIDDIRWKDLTAISNHVMKQGFSSFQALKARRYFYKILLFAKGVEAPSYVSLPDLPDLPRTENNVPALSIERSPADNANLKIKAADSKLISELLADSTIGRFAQIKIDVRKQILTCPPSEIRIIQPTALMLQNKKERTGLMAAIQKMLIDSKLPWVIRWSASEKVFVVLRREQYESLKGAR